MPKGSSFICFWCLLTMFWRRKSILFEKFSFSLRARLQEPSEVDFGCQKRQKSSPFLRPKSRFFGLFSDRIFGIDLRCFLLAIWTILGAILAPELAPKGDQNGTTFGTLFPRISGVGGLRFCELNESAAKATVTGIILGKRKGGIRPLRPSWGSSGPYKDLKSLIRPLRTL